MIKCLCEIEFKARNPDLISGFFVDVKPLALWYNEDMENTKIATADLELVRGDDEPLTLTFTDEENDNAPIDISDFVVWLTLKRDPKQPDSEALLQVVVTNHPRGDEGVAFINVDEEAWDTGYKGGKVPSGKCRFDIQYKDADGKPKTILIGECTVVQDVTHDTEVN